MENFLQSLGQNFVSKNGNNNGFSLKSAQLIGIYFSAHWCPPCRGFTPVLAEFYNKVNANGKVFEVVFASSDSDKETFDEYLSTMPWIALEFGSSVKEDLADKFGVSGIPRLVILDNEGNLVQPNARGDVVQKGVNAFSHWTSLLVKKPVDDHKWAQITTNGLPIMAK